jgi:hypothetical protein
MLCLTELLWETGIYVRSNVARGNEFNSYKTTNTTFLFCSLAILISFLCFKGTLLREIVLLQMSAARTKETYN